MKLAEQLLDAARRLGQTKPNGPDDSLLTDLHNAYIQVVRAERVLADAERRLAGTVLNTLPEEEALELYINHGR